MSWRDHWETRFYVQQLSPDGADRLRVRMRVENGRVVRFSVQYEAVVEAVTYPVVRYDTAHDYAHRDILDWSGHEIAKEWIAGPDRYAEVLTNAITDLKTNWPGYRRDFFGRKP
ncbi:MAG TPA: hypothetical protein VH482_09695 [Thermomicrobiales bacterium]